MRSDKPVPAGGTGEASGFRVSVDQRLAEIRRLVEADEFAEVERLVSSLPDLVSRVPLAARGASLTKIQSVLKDIHARAEARSDEISSDLRSLRSGRIATNAYEASTSLFNLKRGM